MGFAVTRPAARQLVSHRGITVNGNPVNLPSYQVKAGDAIALSERAQKQLRVKEALTVSSTMDLSPSWVEVDSNKFSGVRSEEHTSELQALMRISYAVFCLKK